MMKKYRAILYIFMFASLSSVNSYSQNMKYAELDTLLFYKSQFNKYQFKDIALYQIYTQKIINIIDKNKNERLLFYAHSTLGKIYKIDGLYELAIRNCFQALKYEEYAKDKKEIAEVYDHLIFIYRITGEIDRMFECFEKSVTIKKSIGDIKGIYRSKYDLIYHYRNVGNYMEAFNIAYDALDYFEEQKDTSSILICYHHISRIYTTLGNFDKALEIINGCNKFLNGTEYKRDESRLYNGKGLIQLKLGNYQDALDNFLKSLEIENKFGSKFRILYRYKNIGLAYSYLKNFKPALEYFDICIGEYIKSKRWENLANVYESKAVCYREMNLPDSSIHYYLKSIELCERYDYKEQYLHSAFGISKAYRQIGDFYYAYAFLNKYYELFKEIDNSNVKWEVTAEEFESMRRKDQRLKEIEKKNDLLVKTIITGLVVLLTIVFWVIVIKQKTKIRNSIKVKHELEEQKIELNDQINNQNKELVSKILQLNDDNSGVKLTIKRLIKLKSEMGVHSKQKIQQAINDLEHSVNNNIWEEFEYRFTKVHPLLYKNLSNNFSNLTANDRRLCALIHLNFSSKEISNITRQSHNSILIAKSRLRNKLHIQETDSIADCLHKLVSI